MSARLVDPLHLGLSRAREERVHVQVSEYGSDLVTSFSRRLGAHVEADVMDQIEQIMQAAVQAAHAALGDWAIDDPDSGAPSGTFYEPLDDAARAALDKEELGRGISARTFRY